MIQTPNLNYHLNSLEIKNAIYPDVPSKYICRVTNVYYVQKGIFHVYLKSHLYKNRCIKT